MPTFDAGAISEPLEYDFTTIKKYPYKSAKGTVPEPDDDMIAEFLDGMQKLMRDAVAGGTPAQIPDLSDPDTLLELLDKADAGKSLKQVSASVKLYAALCSDHPSEKELMALPMRVRVRFFAWVNEQVINPEAGPGAGIAPVIALPSAVAGSSATSPAATSG